MGTPFVDRNIKFRGYFNLKVKVTIALMYECDKSQTILFKYDDKLMVVEL